MKTSLERLPKSRIRLSVEVPQEAVQKAADSAFEKLAEQVEIKGFRKGKAPKRMIFETVGLSRLREAILERLLPETYFAAIQDQKLVPVEGPRVNIESDAWEKGLEEGKVSAGLSFKAEVDVLPKVELKKDYKKLRIESRESRIEEVGDSEVDSVIQHLRRQQAQFKPKIGEAKEGDRVEIEFQGKVGSVPREEFSSKSYPVILGSQSLRPEFEKELVGMKKGQAKTFTLDFPSKTNPETKENVEFSVTLNELQEVILPELTEEFAKSVGQDSLLALRGSVRQSLKSSKEERARRDLEQKIADELISSTDLEVPDSLVHQEIHRMIDALKTQSQAMNMPWEVYLAQLKKTEADLHNDLRNQAEKTVTFGLILGSIINKEGLDSKDKEAGRKAMDRLIEIATGGKQTKK